MSILVENIEFDQFRYLGMQIRPYFFVSHPVVQIQHVQFTIALKELSITMHLVPCAPQYILGQYAPCACFQLEGESQNLRLINHHFTTLSSHFFGIAI